MKALLQKFEFTRWWYGIDRVMLVALLSVMLFGILLIFAASPAVATRINIDKYYFVIHHLVLLVPSLLIIYVVSHLSPRQLRLLALVIFPIMLALTYSTLFFGMQIKGATRWVPLPGGSIQPSEFMKPVFAVVIAWLFAKGCEMSRFPGRTIAIAVFLITVAALLLQPDLGMTVVFTAVFGVQFFLAGLPLLFAGVGAGLAASGLVGAYFIFPHVHSRIDRFLSPQAGDTYQIDRSLEAFLNGGWFGTGPGDGTVKRFLPDAHADFIFSVSGEELGLIWTSLLVLLFIIIVMRGFNRAGQQKDMFILLAVAGLMTQFGLQAMINMGSALHLIPTKGMTLPFVSYGGSSLLALALGMGIVLGLTRRDIPPAAKIRTTSLHQ